MTERIILSIVAVAMFLLTMKKQGMFHKIITGTFTIGILITWTGLPLIITFGFLIFTLGSALTIAYIFTQEHLLTLDKIIIGLTSLIVFTGNLFAIMHWPYGNEIKILTIIPLIAFIILLMKTKMKLKPEIGFMTILAVSCLLKFIKLWT